MGMKSIFKKTLHRVGKTLPQSFVFPCFHRTCILFLNLRNKKSDVSERSDKTHIHMGSDKDTKTVLITFKISFYFDS